MFAHVTVGALDIELSRKFYDATFVELGMVNAAVGFGDSFDARLCWRF